MIGRTATAAGKRDGAGGRCAGRARTIRPSTSSEEAVWSVAAAAEQRAGDEPLRSSPAAAARGGDREAVTDSDMAAAACE